MGGGRWISFCLIKVYWILSSQPSSNDQSALMLPYCVYKCKLINIAAKHPQDSERAPLEPNTNYMYVSGEMATQYIRSMLNSKRSKHIGAEKLVCKREPQSCRLWAPNWKLLYLPSCCAMIGRSRDLSLDGVFSPEATLTSFWQWRQYR